MRKVLLQLIILFFVSLTVANGQVFITELADPDNNTDGRFIELYNAGATDVNFAEDSSWRIDKYTNAAATASKSLNLTGIIPAGGFYIIATGPADGDFFTLYGVNADQFDGEANHVAGSNGDDNLELYNGVGTLIDQFGVPGEDGTGTNHEFEDGRAERVATVTTGNPVWDFAEWNIDSDAPTGNGPQFAPADFDPGAWIGDPSVVIDPEPTNHVLSFAAVGVGFDQVDLSWTENDGAQAPEGYLIKSSTVSYAAIIDPVDGTHEFTDSDMSDSVGVVNIAHGFDVYNWTGPTGLAGGTTYYYKIYPFTNFGSNIDYKTDGTIPQADATTGTPPVLPNIVINEFLADPDPVLGDANGDGTVNTSEDEFVEFVNIDGASVDIGGYTIEDGFGIRHTFPIGTIIPDSGAVVVFGGGTPTGIAGAVFVADDGLLGLNNSGDIIILKDGSGNTIATYSYGSEGGDNQSLAREPDLTGGFVKHTTIASNPVPQSPGAFNTTGDEIPVELTSFTANVVEGKIRLVWTTATELNNYGFNVERKIADSDWMNIGFVEGAGNSTNRVDYSFIDKELISVRVQYRLQQVDFDGSFEYSNVVEMDLGLPTEFELSQNYPNPFNPTTAINFSLPEAAVVKISVYNAIGEQIVELLNNQVEAGYHTVNFDGSNLTSGLYFFRIEAANFTSTKKMMLLK
ncbi:MAG: T9SS type A sorting domain-containing protein [Ignavibacteriae bacterium]|nr:T9SS C-terminal target domain-containing protein [Ignavibacteriota bacterium]NOG97638.1 T9SS type A sorting domain-containing protein [Ignavibacteriota bacterium]